MRGGIVSRDPSAVGYSLRWPQRDSGSLANISKQLRQVRWLTGTSVLANIVTMPGGTQGKTSHRAVVVVDVSSRNCVA